MSGKQYKKKNIKSSWKGKTERMIFHSEGWHPKTINDVHVLLSRRAMAMMAIIQPLLERSLEKYQAQTFRTLTSTYDGHRIIIKTSRDNEGFLTQLALTADDLPYLPEDIRLALEGKIKNAVKKGPFTIVVHNDED